MGPRALKVLSMCLCSCLKQPSLQNFTRLTQPFFPVCGISSKLLSRPSTPLFLSPVPWPPFLPLNFPSTTVPAAVIHRALWEATPKNTFLDPRAPCALVHPVTRMDMLLMVQTKCVHRPHAELWHHPCCRCSCRADYFPPPTPTSCPWKCCVTTMNWYEVMIYESECQSSRETQQNPNVRLIHKTNTLTNSQHTKAKKSKNIRLKKSLIQVSATAKNQGQRLF